MSEKFKLSARIDEEMAGWRLDQAAAHLFPDFSRARLQGWIKDGSLLVDDRAVKARHKLYGGECLTLDAEVQPQEEWVEEDIPLDIVHEDEAILVLDKPAGLVVHPAAGNRSGTLLNGLLHHCPSLDTVPRAGIVHRLDKDTSGLMVVAKTLSSHLDLVGQLQDRSMAREYQAVVQGVLTAGGTVDAPLGRHPTQRTKRAVVSGADSRPAVTHYRLMKRFRAHTHVQLRLETGRTHQIRVHMTYIGHPLMGDPAYGGRLRIPAGTGPQLRECLQDFRRQALHAFRLGLRHPVSGEFLQWESPLPADMRRLLEALEQDEAGQG